METNYMQDGIIIKNQDKNIFIDGNFGIGFNW